MNIKRKIKNLKVGDKVVAHYANRVSEGEVLKIGRQYITTNHCYCNRYDFNGWGDNGWDLFPGNIEEYNDYLETTKLSKELLKKLETIIHYLDKESLNKIQNIIDENEI